MGAYSQFISEERRAVPTPKSLVNDDGTCVFGTFDREFKDMDLLRAKKPTHAPQAVNRLKLTLWEATEVHLKHGVLLAVVCDMGIFGKTLNIFYDKRTKKVYAWDTNLKSSDTVIAPNLTNGRVTEARTGVSHVLYINHFEMAMPAERISPGQGELDQVQFLSYPHQQAERGQHPVRREPAAVQPEGFLQGGGVTHHKWRGNAL